MSESDRDKPVGVARPSLMSGDGALAGAPGKKVLADLAHQASAANRRWTGLAFALSAAAICSTGYWALRGSPPGQSNVSEMLPTPIAATVLQPSSMPVVASNPSSPAAWLATGNGMAQLSSPLGIGTAGPAPEHPFAAVMSTPVVAVNAPQRDAVVAPRVSGSKRERAKPRSALADRRHPHRIGAATAKKTPGSKSSKLARKGDANTSDPAGRGSDPDTELLAAMLRRSTSQQQASRTVRSSPNQHITDKEAP